MQDFNKDLVEREWGNAKWPNGRRSHNLKCVQWGMLKIRKILHLEEPERGSGLGITTFGRK